MSHEDNRGRPVLQDIDPYYEPYEYRVNYGTAFSPDMSVRERGANLDQSMGMINQLLEFYEMTYYPHSIDKNLLHMPYLFLKPDEGTRMINTTTNEVYVIEDIVSNPKTKRWEGLVRISSTTPPDKNLLHKLKFIDIKDRVRFTQEFSAPLQIPQGSQQSVNETEIDAGPMIPTVTWALIREEPGTFGREPFGPQKLYKGRPRELLKDPDNPGHSIDVRVQTFDNLVQFDCWTTDNFASNKLANWFKKFLSLYIPILKRNGVQEMLFWQRLRDSAVTKWRQDLISRTLQYFVRTEDIDIVTRKDIVSIDYTFEVDSELQVDYFTYIADQKVVAPGQLTVKAYNDLFKNSDGEYLFGSFTINDGNF